MVSAWGEDGLVGIYFQHPALVRRQTPEVGLKREGEIDEDVTMSLFSRSRTELPTDPQRWKEALEAALKVSEIASSAMLLQDAIQAMLRAAMDLLPAEQGSIMLLEDNGRALLLVASAGLPTEAQLGSRLAVGESIAGRVLATGKPLLLGEVDKDAFVNFVPKTRPISSSVVVPLRAQGRTSGVLNLAVTATEQSFTDEDLRVAQMFADQVAGLIFRARLHERAEQRSSDLMALVDSSRGLLGTLDVEALLQRVLDGGARLAGSKDGFACLFDPDSNSITRGVFRGLDKSVIPSVVAEPSVQKAIANSDVAILEEEEHTLVAVGLRTTRGTKGLLVAPADRELVNDRADLLRAFGQQAGLAIGAAELHSVIERKETELASIIQGVPNPIVLVDTQHRIVAINPAAEELFGLSAIFSAGASVEGTMQHEEVESLLTGEGSVTTEVEAGSPARTYKVRVTDVRVPGAPIGRVLIMDDVTAEREMAQTQRDFVAMIGHELRTPLTIVKGFARTMLRRIEKGGSPQEAKEALATIDAKANQLERLIEDLLYVSQIESREASLRTEKVDVSQLIKVTADDVIQTHGEREIRLDIPENLEWPCDETKVGLVLRHLLENSLKYSEAPTPVSVFASIEDDELRVDIVDEGRGIVSSDIPHIFERFRQLDSTSTREHGGTGVGLYLCAQLIRVHGGRIWVDSAWGKGSTFSFSLPKRSTGNQVVTISSRQTETA